MTRLIVLALSFLSSTSVLAQAQQQKYVPFVVEEQDARNIRAYLDEQQMKIALPILQWMEGLEAKAIAKVKEAAEKAAAEAKAKEEAKPDGK